MLPSQRGAKDWAHAPEHLQPCAVRRAPASSLDERGASPRPQFASAAQRAGRQLGLSAVPCHAPPPATAPLRLAPTGLKNAFDYINAGRSPAARQWPALAGATRCARGRLARAPVAHMRSGHTEEMCLMVASFPAYQGLFRDNLDIENPSAQTRAVLLYLATAPPPCLPQGWPVLTAVLLRAHSPAARPIRPLAEVRVPHCGARGAYGSAGLGSRGLTVTKWRPRGLGPLARRRRRCQRRHCRRCRSSLRSRAVARGARAGGLGVGNNKGAPATKLARAAPALAAHVAWVVCGVGGHPSAAVQYSNGLTGRVR